MMKAKKVICFSLLIVSLFILVSCGSNKTVCPSCGKNVDALVTAKDAAGETCSWCSSCWNDYWAIMNAGKTEDKTESIPNQEPTSTPEPTAVPDPEPEIFEEDGRYGVRFEGKSIADSIWQYIDRFKYNGKYYYLVTLNEKTGLMDENGDLIVEPVWEKVYDFYQGNDGKNTIRPVEKYLSFTDKGYIILNKSLYQIDSGKTMEYPGGTVVFLDGNILLARKYTSGDAIEFTVYDFRNGKVLDQMKSYKTSKTDIYYGFSLTENGNIGILVKTAYIYDSDRDKHPYDHYGYYSLDGSLVLKTSGHKPVILSDEMVIAECYYDKSKLHQCFKLYDLNNGKQISDLSFAGKWTPNEDPFLPEIYNADGDRVMIATTSHEMEETSFVIVNLTKRTAVKLPADIIDVQPFSDARAAVKNASGKWGYINQDGAFVYECQFDEGRPFENGSVETIRNYKKVTLQKSNSEMPQPVFATDIPTIENAEVSINKATEGFFGEISVHVIFNGNQISSLTINAPYETEGLGRKVEDEEFVKQFIGKTGPFAFGEDGIDAVTGATQSSNSALDAINQAVEENNSSR